MKATFIIAATAGLVAAQDLSSLPECARGCVQEALAAQNCSDAECACSDEVQSAITSPVITCLDEQSCPSEDLAALTEFQSTGCASQEDAAATGDVTSAADADEPAATGEATSAADGDEVATTTEAPDAAATGDDDSSGTVGGGSGSGNETSTGNGTSTTEPPTDVSGAGKSVFFGFATLFAGLLIAV